MRQAQELLSDWAVVVRSRDERVRTAVESGLSKSEVSRITGIARSTIHRIIESAPDGSPRVGGAMSAGQSGYSLRYARSDRSASS